MNHRNRKDKHLSPAPAVRKPALVVASFAAIVGAAHAQSSATTSTSINYSFSVDASSADPASDLQVTDNGEVTYNLISPFAPPPSGYFAPYTYAGGADASAYTFQSPLIGFNSGTMSGYNGVSSGATLSGSTGDAAASVGSQEELTLTDSGPNSITVDVNGMGFIGGSTAIAPGLGASETGYVGIFAFSYTTGAVLEDYIVQNSVNGSLGTYMPTGPWTGAGGSWSVSDSFTVLAGQTYGLEFYASGVAEAVPAPTGLLTLGVGMVGLMLRRRKIRR